MKIVMISAKSQHGKDTIAKIMREQLEKAGKKVLIIHFADLVKHYAVDYYNWDGNKDEEGRALLQMIGTGLLRSRWPEYWAEIVGKFLDAIGDLDDTRYGFNYVLIPDWRFINEFETISQYAKLFNNSVTTIRVKRYNNDGSQYINSNMTQAQLLHVSECQLDNFPFEWIIENRGTIDDLKNSIEIMLEHI